MFRLSSTIREQCYLILFLSVSIKIIEQDKFYTPVIEYFQMLRANQVSNINNTFGVSEKMNS